MSKPLIRLLFDSGAFSAWRKDIQLDLKEYIKYIKRNKDLMHAYVCLDSIPGSKGRLIRTPQSVEKSAKSSYENLQRMKDAGLSPIPVFHQGESFDWLERLIEDKEPYIGISPYLRAHRNELFIWLDKCFEMLESKRGKRIIKTHGFGATGPAIVIRYPWTTVDSTSWALKAGFGTVYIPSLDNKGEFNFAEPITYKFSWQSSNNKSHFATLGPNQKAHVNRFLEEIGLSFYGLCCSRLERYKTNIAYYQGLQDQYNRFNIVFADIMHSGFNTSNSLTERSANFRLLSYFDTKDSEHLLDEYVSTGCASSIYKKELGWTNETYRSNRIVQLIERMKENQDATN